MATTNKVVFREIGLGVLQFCCAYSLFITLHNILQLFILLLLRQPQRCPFANFHIAISAVYPANLRCERWGLQENPVGPTLWKIVWLQRPQHVAFKGTSCVAPWLPNTDVAKIAALCGLIRVTHMCGFSQVTHVCGFSTTTLMWPFYS